MGIFVFSTLVVSAERELRPNYEILVFGACFQVSLTVFFFGSNKTEVDL